jgi:hypothetical protein
MSGNPLVIFDKDYFFGIYAGLPGDCNINFNANFDSANGEMNLAYSYSSFVSHNICSQVVTPDFMGYTSQYDSDNFHSKIDVQSAVLCIAVNQGVKNMHELEVVFNSKQEIKIPNTEDVIHVSERFDFRYPGMSFPFSTIYFIIFVLLLGMKPIICVDENVLIAKATCFIKIGRTWTLPVFNHYGKFCL